MRLLPFIFIFTLTLASTKTYKKNGLSVKVVDENSGLPKAQIQKILDIFFVGYPKMMKEFRPTGAIKDFVFSFLPKIGVATSYGPQIKFNADFNKMNPKNLNGVLHETFHSLQFSKSSNF